MNQSKPDSLLDDYSNITDFLREFRAGLADEECKKRERVIKNLVGEVELDAMSSP